MFDKDVRIYGKHANYWKDLCELPGNVPDRELHSNFKIFKSYVDAYILCPLIGFQYNRKGIPDSDKSTNAGMLAEVLSKRQRELKYVYQLIMLLDEDSEPDKDKRLFRAFKFAEETPQDAALIKKNMETFTSYFLGGLEVLHEEFVEQCVDVDDYLNKIYEFTKLFDDLQNEDVLKEKIDKMINN